MASFFLRGTSENNFMKGSKRKKTSTSSKFNKLYNSSAQLPNEEISSDSEEEINFKQPKEIIEDNEETAQEKRLRLTKQYLKELEAEVADKDASAEERIRTLAVSKKIEEDILEQSNRLFKTVANKLQSPDPTLVKILKGHSLAVTCLVISSDHKYIYSGSKDCSIIKWSAETQNKVHRIPGGRKGTEAKHIGHTDHVFAIAVSYDNKFLVSGDKNKFIFVWNPVTMQYLQTLTKHKSAITGLVFRKNTSELFSTSSDRSVIVWNLDEMAYVETLFGHEDGITAVDSLIQDRAVSSGGRDGTIRIWKIAEESQLIYNFNQGSIDCVKLINESHFVSGGEDGCVSLWSVSKKKPLVTFPLAHKCDVKDDQNEINWITSVAAFHNSDLIASGSKNGYINFWQCGPYFKSINLLFGFPITGFINSLQFASDGSFLVVGVGQEHRLGRWWKIKEAKNAVYIIPLNYNET